MIGLVDGLAGSLAGLPWRMHETRHTLVAPFRRSKNSTSRQSTWTDAPRNRLHLELRGIAAPNVHPPPPQILCKSIGGKSKVVNFTYTFSFKPVFPTLPTVHLSCIFVLGAYSVVQPSHARPTCAQTHLRIAFSHICYFILDPFGTFFFFSRGYQAVVMSQQCHERENTAGSRLVFTPFSPSRECRR